MNSVGMIVSIFILVGVAYLVSKYKCLRCGCRRLSLRKVNYNGEIKYMCSRCYWAMSQW